MDKLTLGRLKVILNYVGLPVSGNKPELIERLEWYLEQSKKTLANLDEEIAKMKPTRSRGPIDGNVGGNEGDSGVSNQNDGDIRESEEGNEACSREVSVSNQNDELGFSKEGVSNLRRTNSIRSIASSSSISSSLASNSKRMESLVKVAKMRATKEKRRELIRKEQEERREQLLREEEERRKKLKREEERRLLELELNEAELEAEESAWKGIEDGRRDLDGDPEPEDDGNNERILSNGNTRGASFVDNRKGERDSSPRQSRVCRPKLRLQNQGGRARDAREVNCREWVDELEDENNLRSVCDRNFAGQNHPFSDRNAAISEREILHELVISNNRSRLPKRTIEIFDGSVQKYSLFRTAFQSTVGTVNLTNKEKLHYMHQFTSGLPQRLVESCLYRDSSEGYQEAWRLLDRKYGSVECIGNAHIEKILAYPEVGRDDVSALENFSVQLIMAWNAVSRLPYGRSELDNPKTIRHLVAKLPYSLQDRWRRVAHRVGEVECKVAGFQEFSKFVEEESNIVNNPIFGRKTAMNVEQRILKPRKALVGVIQEDLVCILCSGRHSLENCNTFRSQSITERYDFLRKNRVCFMCFGVGHFARNCASPQRCNYCSGWHPSLLHKPLTGDSGDRFESEPNRSAIPSGRDFSKRSDTGGTREIQNARGVRAKNWFASETVMPKEPSVGNNRVLSGTENSNNKPPVVMTSSSQGSYCGKVVVVPVILDSGSGSKIKTYALVDEGSAVTLCTKDLLGKLGMQRQPARTNNMRITTICGTCIMDGWFVAGMIMRNVCDGEEVRLPPVYSIEEIPVDKEDAVNDEDIMAWDHLRGICMEDVGRVEMIIGANVPHATEPLEVIQAPSEGAPYAVKTRLGWTVHGVGTGSKRDVKVGRVSVKDRMVEEMVLKAFDVGFENMGSCDEGLSEEDKIWVKTVEGGCRKVAGRFEIPLPMRDIGVNFPNSRAMAVKRAYALKGRLTACWE